MVGIILESSELRQNWLSELATMQQRIKGLRTTLAQQLGEQFDFIQRESGMFSFLGISQEEVTRLREKYGIYMVDSSRINVSGLNSSNIDYFLEAVRSL